MNVGAKIGTPEWRARVSKGTKRAAAAKREAARVRPRDLARLRKSGTVAKSLRPLVAIAETEAAELMAALGGSEEVSEMRRLIVEDLVAVGMVLRAELARFLQTGEPDAGARVSTLANTRRASLAALGLDRVATPVPDLRAYLAEREEAGS